MTQPAPTRDPEEIRKWENFPPSGSVVFNTARCPFIAHDPVVACRGTVVGLTLCLREYGQPWSTATTKALKASPRLLPKPAAEMEEKWIREQERWLKK